MIPVPIIESIELEADGRAVIWITTPDRIFHAIDRHHFDDPTHLEDVVPEPEIKLTLRVTDVASGGSIAYTTVGGILEALADAGVLEKRESFDYGTGRHSSGEWFQWLDRPSICYVSPWKEAK